MCDQKPVKQAKVWDRRMEGRNELEFEMRDGNTEKETTVGGAIFAMYLFILIPNNLHIGCQNNAKLAVED